VPNRLLPLLCLCILVPGLAQAGPRSVNSTSQNRDGDYTPVATPPPAFDSPCKLLGVNALGMHCGDLDGRVVSLLPPFNEPRVHLVCPGAAGNKPSLLDASDAMVEYRATAAPGDPVRSLPALDKTYKTNFWQTAWGAYGPLYPPAVLDAFSNTPDTGLPVPDIVRLYLGDGALAAHQQKMPGGDDPYGANEAQAFGSFIADGYPFFMSALPDGYVARIGGYFAAEGVPPFGIDDAGRTNPYPLYWVGARALADNRLGVAAGTLLGSLDLVLPVSGEADCRGCHTLAQDGGNETALPATPVLSIDDPDFGDVPEAVSREWAADENMVRLHDEKHGTTLAANEPVVCQVCHYTPALDLAQVGPVGPENPDANGREQTRHVSMSRAIHGAHARYVSFPGMPPAVDGTGRKRDPALAETVLENTCYQCHPGKDTDCARGAMRRGGAVCQDCHGDAAQVGNDFSGSFAQTHGRANWDLRVPWFDEPRCGSCHTGDVLGNLARDPDVLVNPEDHYGNRDGLRLAQAYRVGDGAAEPIRPANGRFAEPLIADAGGDPQVPLYRMSAGHGGLLCQACHGATHAEWPNVDPFANDSVQSKQLQRHTGVIIECGTCHNDKYMRENKKLLQGPHGMHFVSADFVADGHSDAFERNPDSCRECHGMRGEGTVLAAVKAWRSWPRKEDGPARRYQTGELVACNDCHELPEELRR